MGKGGILINVAVLEIPYQLCIFLFCCIGPVLVVVGAVLVSLAAVPDRENSIDGYNRIAEAFSLINQEFQATTFTLFGNSFEPISEPDYLADTGNFASYTPFKYVLQDIPMDNITSDQILIDVDSPFLHQIYLGVIPVQRGFSLSQASLNCHDDSLPCNSRSCQKLPLCSASCESQNGVWSETSHTCAVTHFLQEICVKVSQASSSWTLDSSFGGTGCFYKGKEMADSEGNLDPTFDPWSPLLYLKDEVAQINFTIRHANDPQILASSVTMGTYNFGKPVGEKIVTGVVLLAVGGALLLIVPIGVFFFVRWLMKHERGVKKHYRNGGLEKLSSMDVRMQPRVFETSPPSSPPKHPLPPPHIFDIYVSPGSN